jgi:hypothetical protein
MNDDKLQKLAIKYPDLMSKSTFDYVECNEGWDNILEVLFGMISNKVSNARGSIFYLVNRNQPVPEAKQAQLDKEIAALPIISQIKEKFGGLRFYMDFDDETPEEDRIQIYNYVDFAEAMSSKTCVICGSPSTPRSNCWATLCGIHHEERLRERELDK